MLGQSSPSLDSVENVVAICGRQIGDLTNQEPTIHALSQLLGPLRKLTLFVSSLVAPIVPFLGAYVEVEVFNPKWARHPWGHQHDGGTAAEIVSSVKEFTDRLSRMQAQAVLILDRDPWLAAGIGASKIESRIGFVDERDEHSLTLAPRIPVFGHQSERFHVLVESWAEQLGVTCPTYRPPELTVDQESDAYRKAESILQEQLANGWKGIVAIQACASYGTKNAHPHLWGNVIEGIQDMGRRAVLIGAKGDIFEAQASINTQRKVSKALDLRGKLPLPVTYGLLSLDDLLVIGVDSFAVHAVAAFANKKPKSKSGAICDFGAPNDPLRWGPAGPPGRIRIFCQPPRDRSTFRMGLTQYPEGTKGYPYTERVTAADILDAAALWFGLQ
jgi:ADP-heptose:LPS heptosyltransferase